MPNLQQATLRAVKVFGPAMPNTSHYRDDVLFTVNPADRFLFGVIVDFRRRMTLPKRKRYTWLYANKTVDVLVGRPFGSKTSDFPSPDPP